MSVSKYLPPYTAEERGAIAGGRAAGGHVHWTPIDPAAADAEATYADFLGDEVDD